MLTGNTMSLPTALRRAAWSLVMCVLLVSPSWAATPTSNVLVLFSNNRLLPANIDIDHGLREVIGDTPQRNVDLFAEFLDRPAFSGAAYEQSVATYLADKYATRPPQVIVVAGEEALGFMLSHRAVLFPKVPIVHLAIDKPFLRAHQPLPADVVGVPTSNDYLGTIEWLLRCHPQLRRLVVVTGASEWDREREAELRAGLEHSKIPAVEFLAAQATDVVQEKLRGLGAGDVVFTTGYFTDGAGRTFTPRESAALMTAVSGAPIYAPYDTFIGTGVVGGRMASYIDMGREAGREVNALILGAAPEALRLPQTLPMKVQVDWRQVRKWGIDPRKIPADAVVFFREPTFWEAYRSRLIVFAAVLLIQAALIAALLVERRHRRRTASQLAESEMRMNLAARAARLSLWIWDVARDKFWTTTGLRPDRSTAAVIPVQFDQVLNSVHPADREEFNRRVRQALAHDEELDVEYRTLQPDGEVRWVAARGRVERGGGERLMGVALDVTPRKQAELQAEKDRAALTHMTRVSMMGQLSASIAHQLNQPLAAILGNAETARKMLERTPLDLAELKDICDDIVSEDKRAAEVIRRLGAFYKRGEMKIAPFDLNELICETLELVRTQLMTRQVADFTELAPSLPVVNGDRVQLQQVVLNLILNAADAMSDVEVGQRRLLVRTEIGGPNVQLSVVDQGKGIPPAEIGNIFEAFWSTKAGGMGVGLAICKSIITAHRGTLTATNNPGGGATLSAAWPARMLPES